MYIVDSLSDPSDGINPVIDQRYAELFGSKPRTVADQKQFERNIGSIAGEALAGQHYPLSDSRRVLASSMCHLFTGSVRDETAQLLYDQASKQYDKVVSNTARRAAHDAAQRLTGMSGVSGGEAIQWASAKVVELETTKRLRQINEAFSDAFNEKNRQRSLGERALNYLLFVTTYPDRPSHVLLKGYPALDNPLAEVAYGMASRDNYLLTFEDVTHQARTANQHPDIMGFLDTAIGQTLAHDLALEAQATKEALQGVL